MVWTTPLGAPVEPEVNRMNGGILGVHRLAGTGFAGLGGRLVVPNVAPLGPGDLAAGAPDDDRGFDDVAGFLDGGVHVDLQGHPLRPPRRPSSAVMRTLEAASFMRLASDSGEKPPNTTECMAPMRAQASIATAASGIIGM